MTSAATEGRLAGIARHDRPHGPIEPLAQVEITREGGLAGDWRGSLGRRRNRRQVSLIEEEGWAAAMADLGISLPWWQRRANLLVSGLRLPRAPGYRICVGADCIIEVTMECNPCRRVEEVAPGLEAALAPDWRGGALGFVVTPGTIALNDRIRIEK